jgi:hypothetical protein
MRIAIAGQFRFNAYVAWLCMTAPSICHANIGVPMIFVTLPTMGIALLPIIAIEALLAIPNLKLPYRKLLKCFFIANLVSTFVGIPVAWFLLVVLQIVTGGGSAYGLASPATRLLAVTWQAPWLIPYESDLNWMIPAATLVLFVPFFFASWWVEYLVVKRVLSCEDGRLVRRVVRNVNFLSYSGLAIYVVARMYFR